MWPMQPSCLFCTDLELQTPARRSARVHSEMARRGTGVSGVMNLLLALGAELGICGVTDAVVFLKHRKGKTAATVLLWRNCWENFLHCGHDSGWGMRSLWLKCHPAIPCFQAWLSEGSGNTSCLQRTSWTVTSAAPGVLTGGSAGSSFCTLLHLRRDSRPQPTSPHSLQRHRTLCVLKVAEQTTRMQHVLNGSEVFI